MLDGKILAAVLATLAALAVTTSGGDIQDTRLGQGKGFLSGFEMGSLLSSPVESVKEMVFSSPEPENSIRATIQSGNLWQQKIKIKNAKVRPENLTSLNLGSGRISSDTDITLYGFTGKIKPSNLTEFTGKVEGVMASGVNISESSRVSFKLNTREIRIRGAESDSLVFGEARAEFVSESTTTDLRNASRKIKIRGFSGDLTLNPFNRTVTLDGKVGTIDAGSFSFGN